MPYPKTLALLPFLLLLGACGGLQRAVAVVPDTFEDLEARSAAARGEPPRTVSRETR